MRFFSNLNENFRLAFRSLRANKMRSLLTMLGIIVGIASVIAIVALGQGARNAITGEFEDIGSTTTMIMTNLGLTDKSTEITYQDVEAIRKQLNGVRHVAPLSVYLGSAETLAGTKSLFLYGMDSEGINLMSPELVAGRSLTPLDYRDGLNNALIDYYTASNFFSPAEAALGQEIDITLFGGHHASLHIVGVATFSSLSMLTNLTGSTGQPDDQPMVLFVPHESLNSISNQDVPISIIGVMAEDAAMNENVGQRALQILEQRHNNQGMGAYRLQNVSSIVEQVDRTLSIITSFITIVASISLVVGGIGVMNIMLVNVSERTREIGIRKSLGASPKDIKNQFLTESVIITSAGGLIGLIAGIFLAKILAGQLRVLPQYSLGWSLAALITSVAIGVIFGLSPAKRAARMNPIDALRYE